MNNSEKSPIYCLPLAIAFLAGLLLWPVVGVSRPMPADFLKTPQLIVYALVFFTACIAHWQSVALLFALNRNNLIYRLKVLSWCTYISLFITCCLLCRRLKVCLFHIPGISWEVGSWIGPPLVLVGTILVLLPLSRTSLGPRSEKPALIAYPEFLGLLFMLAGTAFAHWAWLPLLALPGVFVVESWYIGQRERIQAEKNDGDRLHARFKILPFIY